MGRKHNQAQRTKNNAKPSSSSRSADLLGKDATKLVGFVSLNQNVFSVSNEVLSHDIETIDPHFQVALKKLSKKDAVTKQKGLQELAELCQKAEKNECKSLLKPWSTVYCQLALDVDNRVRELSHVAHATIVANVGRHLATTLRSVAPVWFATQFDTYAPAASAAVHAFQSAFPSNKVKEVVSFCNEEIFNYIYDNLIQQTPQSLSKFETNKEQVDAKYERVIICSLNGYAHYLEKFTWEQESKQEEDNLMLLSNNKFWKFASHKAPPIRAAWYFVLVSMCKNSPRLVSHEASTITKTVFSHLDESDPLVLPLVWESALHILTIIKDFGEHVNIEKVVLPKLWNILVKGGQGNATVIYPNLLPFVSNLSRCNSVNKCDFYKKFFECLRTGLMLQNVKQSHMEYEIVLKTFMECLRYVIMTEAHDTDLVLHIVDNELLKLLREITVDLTCKNVITLVCGRTVDLLLYWDRNTTSYPIYSTILDRFWSNVREASVQILLNSLEDNQLFTYINQVHFKFLESFIKPVLKQKKSLKVQFRDNKESEESVPDVCQSSSTLVLTDYTKKHLHQLIGALTKTYWSLTENESIEVKKVSIIQLSLIVKLFGLNQTLSIGGLEEDVFCSKLRSWLKDPEIPVESVLVLTFNALNFISISEAKEAVLKDLIQIRPERLVIEAIKLCISSKEEKVEIRDWLRSEHVENLLLTIVNDKAILEKESSLDVLQSCWEAHDKGGYIVGDRTIVSVFTALSKLIESTDSSDTPRILSLLPTSFCHQSERFFVDNSDCMFTLLKNIFSIILKNSSHSKKITNVWKKGLSCMVLAHGTQSIHFQTFLEECAFLLFDCLKDRNDECTESLNNLMAACYALVETSLSNLEENSKTSRAVDVSGNLMRHILNKSKQTWQNAIQNICLLAERVYGFLSFEDYCPNEPLLVAGSWNPLKGIDISGFSQTIGFCVDMIIHLLGEPLDYTSDSVDDPLITSSCLIEFKHHMLDFLYALTLLRSLSKYYSNVKQYYIASNIIEQLTPKLKELFQRIEIASVPLLLSDHRDMHSSEYPMWHQADEILRHDFMEMTEDKGEVVQTQRILTEGLEEGSLRSLRFMLKLKKRELHNHVAFTFWKLTTTCKADATVAYDVSLNNVGLIGLCLSSEIARFLTEVLKYCDTSVDAKGWDFILVATASWINSISKTTKQPYYNEFAGFVVSVCDLFMTLTTYLNKSVSTPALIKLKAEWQEVFASDAHLHLINLWKSLADISLKYEVDPAHLLLCEKLSDAVTVIVSSEVMPLKDTVSATWDLSLFILSPAPAIQLTSFILLQSMAPELAKLDIGLDENSTSKLSCLNLKESLLKAQTILEVMLQDFKLGVTCLVAPYTDSYTYARGYLLLWLVLLDIFKNADSQARHVYTLWIKEVDIHPHLMRALLQLLPDVVFRCLETNEKKVQDIFATPPSFSYGGWSSGRLAWTSGWVYCQVLRVLPVLCRLWYSQTEPKIRDIVDKFTSTYVTPVLIAEEIAYAKQEGKSCENLSIETMPSVRLVTAVYTVEDCKTELVIQLGHNHPFTLLKVDISKMVASSNQAKQKLKQLTLFPTLQNGSLWDSIIAWKNYMDKKFEGVEECYICYSVIHYDSHQIPKLTCRTCKKKFHSACLYKWFTSSNKPTCPICRNLF